MKKIVKDIIKSGKNIFKRTADDNIYQGKETIKSIPVETNSDVVNNSIEDISDHEQTVEESNLTNSHAELSEENYKDGEAFEDNLRAGLLNITSDLMDANPVEVLNKFVTMAKDVAKFTEVQKTKRKGIEAERDIIVEGIQSQKEIFLTYLEKSFDERKENFVKLFSSVDDAIANNNTEQLALGLHSINKLAESSSFKALASIEETKRALEDENHVWDF